MESTDKNSNLNAWQRVMLLNPALVRGLVVAIAAILATVLGRTVIDSALIDSIVIFFASISALVSALWTRGAVTPNDKVVAYKPDPLNDPANVIVPENVHPAVEAAEQSVLGELPDEEDLPEHVKHPEFLDEDYDGVDDRLQGS
jgi:hypothetical protein